MKSSIDTQKRGWLVPAWTKSKGPDHGRPLVTVIVTEGKYKGQTLEQAAANLRLGKAKAYECFSEGREPPSAAERKKERDAKRGPTPCIASLKW